MTLTKRIFAVLGIFAIAGCALFQQEEPEVAKYNEPRFNTSDPIELKVNHIDVISEFTPSFTRPNVEHLFPISIEKTARLWAKDRLKAVDFATDKQAEFIIRDASVTETIEKSDQIFMKDRIVYKAKLNVILRISDPKNLSKGETEIEAWRELKIPSDTDIAEKEKYWNGMVEKLFSEFNVKMEQNIRQYLNMYVAKSNFIHTYE